MGKDKVANWVTYVTLVIALLGGLPGTMNVYKSIFNRPELHVEVYGYTVGEIVRGENQGVLSHVLFSLMVANRGNRPLSPNRFECYVKKRDKWMQLEGYLIPKDIVLQSEVQDIQLDKPWEKDLQRINGIIEYGRSIDGYLAFTTDTLNVQSFRELLSSPNAVKIVCVDIYQNRYEAILNMDKYEYVAGSVELPKVGVIVKPLERKGGNK